ncbi:hypothetical protein ACJIZ3_020330 [Penstemon smallii]|uniref:Uncharacterized protein n=1 Tax=Penstemon smallii TaxID=265156 RepID=A0ABD3SIA1_9LAMI
MHHIIHFDDVMLSQCIMCHLLPYSSPPSIDPQLTANSPKEQQTTAKTANQATKFAKSTRPEHVLRGPKQHIARLNPAD